MEPARAHSFRINNLVHMSNATLASTRILIVGVGGIGCEILKVLCKSPIGTVHILDMDTIELSNLNRQFLFKQQHKGMSKALVAKESILRLNPAFNIHAHHMNIKDLPISFFRQFHIIVLALDNIEARNYVNKIGVRLNIPIVDAGTLAYKGNATTILSQVSRCYSCQPKVSNQKVFPVCTIRMRPEKPIHCIVWAKMLFEALFSADNDDNDLKDLAALASMNDELAMLQKLYQADIESIKNAKSDTDNKLSQIFAKNIKTISNQVLTASIGVKILASYRQHDKVQSLENSVSAFVESFERLTKQKREGGSVVFEKDDDDIIHFVTSAANLRMFCFGIQQQSFNEVKNMAGNIVPAIASTNSIVSGIEIIEMIKYLRGSPKMKSYFIQNQNNKVMTMKLEKPLPTCAVCSPNAIPATFECNFSSFTLSDLVAYIRDNSSNLEEFSINQGSKEIYNTDDPKESLLSKTILQICESYEIDLILTNEDTSKNVCIIWMIHNEQQQELAVTFKEKLAVHPEPEPPIQEETKNGVAHDDDSDFLMCGDEADSPELEIIEVKRRGEAMEVEEGERAKKRQKVE